MFKLLCELVRFCVFFFYQQSIFIQAFIGIDTFNNEHSIVGFFEKKKSLLICLFICELIMCGLSIYLPYVFRYISIPFRCIGISI